MRDRPIPSETDFPVGEMVLAFHGNLLYEARILSVDRKPGERATSYLVHFQGWKKSWEETVAHDQVFQHNDANLRLAHRLLNGAKMRQQAIPSVRSDKDSPPRSDTMFPTSPLPSFFQISPALQRQIVDDFEFVTKERRLVPLPRQPSVQQILHKWVNARRQSTDKATREVAEGIQTYFDAALPKILLYRFEVKQYKDIFQTGTKRDETLLPSAVYGAEHLLRLMIRLSVLVESTEITKETVDVISDKVNELARYMQKNGRTLFLVEYEDASPQYLEALEKIMQNSI